jgi:2-dehydro-3-deoxygluconokinase
LEVTYAGAEANVAVSAAALGHEAALVTTLPAGPLGDAAVASLRHDGVDVSHVVRSDQGRLGIYFLETGASQRPSRVVYDRKDSSIAQAAPTTYHWPEILSGRQALHTTGITPALGPSCATATAEALRAARQQGLLTSLDLNYRARLWSQEDAKRTIEPMLSDVDLVVANEEDAEAVLGIRAEKTNVQRGVIDRAAYEGVARQVREKYGVSRVAITLRESESASINHWSACLLDGDHFLISRRYTIHVVDRVGAGDAFTGGLLVGLLEGMSGQEALELAVAASCLKHTIPGDFNKVSRDEVLRLCAGSTSGRVVR